MILHRLSNHDLVAGIVAYYVSSLGGVTLVKWLNYEFAVSDWLVLALLSRATWLLALPLALFLNDYSWQRLCITRRQLGIYLGVAVGLSIVEGLNSISLSILPGSLYALIKGTDVVWSLVLSRLVLRKQYSIHHVGSVMVITLGIVAVFVLGPPSVTPRHQVTTQEALREAHLKSQSVAAFLCLLGAFFNALLSVVTEATLKEALRGEQERLMLLRFNKNTQHQEHPSKLELSNLYAMWTSIFSFVILSISALVTGQVKHLFGNISQSRNEGASAGSWRVTWLTLSLCGLTISRFVERLGKHWICVRDSAMTFSVVQASRRLLSVGFLAALFHEPFPSSMILGSALLGVGFVWHTWARFLTIQMDGSDSNSKNFTQEERSEEHQEMVSLVPLVSVSDQVEQKTDTGEP